MKPGEGFEAWSKARHETFRHFCQAIKEGVIRCRKCKRAFDTTSQLKHDEQGHIVCAEECRRGER